MDANGTKFHLLLGVDDWQRCSDAAGTALSEQFAAAPTEWTEQQRGVGWDSQRNELSLRPCLFEFVAAPQDVPPALRDRRGAAYDRFGNLYWIDESARAIQVISSGTQAVSRFWPVDDEPGGVQRPRFGEFGPQVPEAMPSASQLGGLAVTEDHYLVVGTIEPAGLLVFDLHAGGPPEQLCWPHLVSFVPFDLTSRPGGGVWILDRANSCYWGIDRSFNVVDVGQETTLAAERFDDFQPTDGSSTRRTAARRFPAGVRLGAAAPVVGDPIAIEALPDCSVLILDRNPGAPFSLVHHYRHATRTGAPLSFAALALVGHDLAFVAASAEEGGEDGGAALLGRMYVVAQEGNQTFAFALRGDGDGVRAELLREYLPMRLFAGKALASGRNGLAYDFSDGWVPLVEQRRPRYALEGDVYTPNFDGRVPDCVWHRLTLDACIPADTDVDVWSRAADDVRDLATAAWQPEPPLYRRGDGSEQPFVPPPAASRFAGSAERSLLAAPERRNESRGTWELLFQRARGRYLQLQLRLSGNGRSSPRLHALRAYYPRFSYLEQYLPGVYRDDTVSASFLDRFLANVEGFYTAIEDKIAAAQTLFDVASAPPDALDWLASWFDVALDPTWGEAKRRFFLAHAMEVFRRRGTPRGVQIAAHLAVDACLDESLFDDAASGRDPIRIIERYRTRRTPGTVLGDPTAGTGPRRGIELARWSPDQGRDNLHRRYTEFLRGQGVDTDATTEFPLAAPPDGAAAALWSEFAGRMLGFTPAAMATDVSRWQDFLARRYHRVENLNEAYRLLVGKLGSFAEMGLPVAVPPDGPPLQDWYQFESVVLAMQRAAHRFTVLLPVTTAAVATADEQQRLELARLVQRVVAVERPAHTVFDVRFYWALFRVGEVRLGEDTVLGQGSRAPELMTPMTLGRDHVGESYLAPTHPQDVAERSLIGRERLHA